MIPFMMIVSYGKRLYDEWKTPNPTLEDPDNLSTVGPSTEKDPQPAPQPEAAAPNRGISKADPWAFQRLTNGQLTRDTHDWCNYTPIGQRFSTAIPRDYSCLQSNTPNEDSDEPKDSPPKRVRQIAVVVPTTTTIEPTNPETTMEIQVTQGPSPTSEDEKTGLELILNNVNKKSLTTDEKSQDAARTPSCSSITTESLDFLDGYSDEIELEPWPPFISPTESANLETTMEIQVTQGRSLTSEDEETGLEFIFTNIYKDSLTSDEESHEAALTSSCSSIWSESSEIFSGKPWPPISFGVDVTDDEEDEDEAAPPVQDSDVMTCPTKYSSAQVSWCIRDMVSKFMVLDCDEIGLKSWTPLAGWGEEFSDDESLSGSYITDDEEDEASLLVQNHDVMKDLKDLFLLSLPPLPPLSQDTMTPYLWRHGH